MPQDVSPDYAFRYNAPLGEALLKTAGEYFAEYGLPCPWMPLRRRFGLRIKYIPFPDYLEALETAGDAIILTNVNLARFVMPRALWDGLGPMLQRAIKVKLDTLKPGNKPKAEGPETKRGPGTPSTYFGVSDNPNTIELKPRRANPNETD